MTKYFSLISKVREGVEETHVISLDQGFQVLKDKHEAPTRRE